MSSDAAADQQPQWSGSSRDECERMVEHALRRNSVVKFMVEKMGEAGCAVSGNFVRIETCTEAVGGGFRPPDGVVICNNHLSAQEEVSHALVHELVHAYDHCRGADLDWTNCEHHACSEVRAASLSGDCHFKQEMLRGNFGFRGQHQRCVRRRAELSVSMNPYCSAGDRAKHAVDKVFEPCFADTTPFDRIP